MIEGLLVLVVASILVTAVVNVLKPILPNAEKTSFYASILIGVLFAFTLGLDVFLLLGFTASIPFVGIVATGLIISTGAGGVYDLIKLIQNAGKEEKLD